MRKEKEVTGRQDGESAQRCNDDLLTFTLTKMKTVAIFIFLVSMIYIYWYVEWEFAYHLWRYDPTLMSIKFTSVMWLLLYLWAMAQENLLDTH